MRKLAFLVLPALLALAPRPAYASGILWYNGDFDGVQGLSNEVNTFITQSYVFDDFTVPSGGWTLDGAFSNNLTFITGSSADIEIRTGVSSGDGGTVVYSAYGVAATQTATGRSFIGLTEYTFQVALPNVFLGAGTYWLTVAPIDSGAGRFFVSTTSGANCIGLPCGNDGNSFFYSTDVNFPTNFGPASDQPNVPNPADFSLGVIGTDAAAPVPEPTSLLLLGTGLAAVARRRFKSGK